MRRAWLALSLAVAAAPLPAAAHPLSFGALRVTEREDRVALSFRYSGPEGAPRAATPRIPPRCRALAPPRPEPIEGGVALRTWLRCEGGLRGAAFGADGLDGAQLMVRIEGLDGEVVTGLIDDDDDAVALAATPPTGAVIGAYLALGVEHIALGYDHLLFLLGVLLLLDRWRTRLAATLAFTVGHGATLALVTLGAVRAPSGPVEAVIALSIVLVAVELARGRRWRRGHAWAVAGGFGLLHGLGFAGALAEVGVPRGAIAPALFGFNLGVELGQLAIVGLFAAGLLALERLTGEAAPAWARRAPTPARARLALAYVIGPLAAALVMARVSAWWP